MYSLDSLDSKATKTAHDKLQYSLGNQKKVQHLMLADAFFYIHRQALSTFDMSI